MRGKKIIGLLLSVVTLIFMVACLLFFQANEDYKAQRGIEEAIKAYSATMKEQEIKVLTSEINDAVDKKLKEIDTGNMSDEELEDLMLLVVQELEKATAHYRETDITQDEVYRIASQIVEKSLKEEGSKLTRDQQAFLDNYQKQLELLAKRQDSLDSQLEQARNSLSNQVGQLEQTRNSLSDQLNRLEQNQGSKFEGLSEELSKAMNELAQEWKKKLEGAEAQLQSQSEKINQLEGNILYYTYDKDTQTLQLFGK